jgi:rod shape-determining protein MreD
MVGKIAVFAALVILAIIFQTFFASLISIDKVMPDIFVILVIYLTLTQGLAYGVIFAFVSGIAESSSDPMLFGLSALLKILLAVATYAMSNRFRLESNFSRVLIVLVGVAAHNLIYYLVTYGFNISLTMYTSVRYIFLDAAYSAVVTVILIYLSERKLTLKFEA